MSITESNTKGIDMSIYIKLEGIYERYNNINRVKLKYTCIIIMYQCTY